MSIHPEGKLCSDFGSQACSLSPCCLAASGLSCKQLGEEAFVGAMYEKLIWICAFMAVGAAHPGATVGDVESEHRAEVVALIEVGGAMCSGTYTSAVGLNTLELRPWH